MVFLHQPPSQCTLPICDDLDDDKEEEDFQTVSLEDDYWSMEKFQIDINAYMNIHYLMDYVHTHAHIWITHLHHAMTP